MIYAVKYRCPFLCIQTLDAGNIMAVILTDEDKEKSVNK